MPACRHFLMWVFKILVLTLLEETNKFSHPKNNWSFKKSFKVFKSLYKRKKISVVLTKKTANSFDSFWFRRTLLEETNNCLHIFDTATLFISFFHSFFDFLFFNFSKFYFFVCLLFSFKSFEICFDFSAVSCLSCWINCYKTIFWIIW